MIVLDLETELIAPGRAAPRPVLAQAANFPAGPDAYARGNTLMCRPGSPTFLDLVAEFFRVGGSGQNMPFDLGALCEWKYATIEQVFDVLDRGILHSVDNRQRLLDIAEGCYYWRPYNLGAIAERYAIEGIDKASPWRTRFSELEHVPFEAWPESARDYALGDVSAPEVIWHGQEQERARIWASVGSDPLVDEARALRAQWALWLVAAHGVVPDREALEYYWEWVDVRQKEARKVLLRAGLLRLSGGKYKKEQKKMRERVVSAWTARAGKWASLGDWLRHRDETPEAFMERSGLDSYALEQVLDSLPVRGLEAYKAKIVAEATGWEVVPYPRTESGKFPSLDAPTADVLDLPELRAWLEYNSAHSAESRWSELALTLCPKHREANTSPGREAGRCGAYGCDWRAGVVHTRFGLAESGRSRSSGPNLQNRPRVGPDRECFAPARGLVYLVTDHDQLELSTVAQVLIAFGCGDNLARAINAGMDGHLMLAADLLEISYEEAKKRYQAGDKVVKKWRIVAKAANFGFAGGLGVGGFMGYALQIYGVQISLNDAKRVRDAWFRRWSEFRAYFKMIGDATRRGKATIRQLYTGRLRGGVGYTDAANTLFQGLGGDLTSSVLYEIQRDTRRTPILDSHEVVEAFTEYRYRFGYKSQMSQAIAEIAEYLSATPRDVTNCALYGARVENYVHDEYLLAVGYRPVREGALVVDPLLELRALAKEYVIRTVSERWLPDMRPTATANACARWSKSARDVRDEHGRPIVWEVCDEVDEVARVFGSPALEEEASPWAREVCGLARGADPIRLHARLAGLVPGYRKAPSMDAVRSAIGECF